MKESEGKRIAREQFYRSCLTNWMTPSQLRSGNFLLLMGEEPREIPYLDEMGVPRTHVWSVERNSAIYRTQQKLGLGISLYNGDLVDYLNLLLHHDQAAVTLNLDIEGSYLNNLDPAMTSVLLFCWRNPETVVATYGSVGRDTKTLWEGAKSLALFMWLCPDETKSFCERLACRYEQAGFRKPFYMVLRDLFWIRSHLEHSVITSSFVGVTDPEFVDDFFAAQARLWSRIRSKRLMPLMLGDLSAIIERCRQDEELVRLAHSLESLKVGLIVRNQQHVIYRAHPPWSQRCYYAKLISREPPVSCAEWLATMLDSFVADPLVYVDREGCRHDIVEPTDGNALVNPGTIVCDIEGLNMRFRPRRLPTRPLEQFERTINSILRLRRRLFQLPEEGAETSAPGEATQEPENQQEEGETVSGNSQPRIVFMRDGELTDKGKERLRDLASQGLSTEEIAELVPRSVPRQSIVAHRAIANRKKKKKRR